jgi:DNA modification methylase
MELFNADCLDKMKDLIDDSIDLIFCDLPYGQTSCKWDCKIDLDLFWKQIMRIKKINTPIFFTTTTKFGVELINSAPKKCPFRYDICYIKSQSCSFLNSRKMPMRKHEMIYVFYEKLPFYDLSSHKHKFLKEQPIVNEKYTYQQDKEKDLYGTDIRKEVRTGKGVGKSPIYDPPLPTTALEIKSTRGKHSTEKPVALMEWILKYYSKEGDTVLDPTMGSGSMGVACKNMNRGFIGIEKDKEIFKVAEDRLK